MLYKIINGVVAISFHAYLQPRLRFSRSHTLGHIKPYQTNINAFKYSSPPPPEQYLNMEQFIPHKFHRPPQLMLSGPASIATLSLNKITITMPFLSLHQKHMIDHVTFNDFFHTQSLMLAYIASIFEARGPICTVLATPKWP